MFLLPAVNQAPATPPSKYTPAQLFGMAAGIIAGTIILFMTLICVFSSIIQRRCRRSRARKAQEAENSLTLAIPRRSRSLRSHTPSWREGRYAFELPREVAQQDVGQWEMEMSVLPSYHSAIAERRASQGDVEVASDARHHASGSDQLPVAAPVDVDEEKLVGRLSRPPPVHLSRQVSRTRWW